MQKLRIFLGAGFAGFALLLLSSSLSLLGKPQEPTDGKELFEKRCGGCHSLDKNKEGPRLADVYGRASASVDGFQYSDALKKLNITWDEDSLDRWLTDPEKVAPNNDMSFHVEKAEERRAIIAFLKQSAGK